MAKKQTVHAIVEEVLNHEDVVEILEHAEGVIEGRYKIGSVHTQKERVQAIVKMAEALRKAVEVKPDD